MTFARIPKHVATACCAALIVACSGSDTPAPPAPAPIPAPNTAPVFSTDTAVDIAENTVGPVLPINVMDNEGDTITLTLGGPDAGAFVLDTATLEIRLDTALDFEMPTDADTDNIYDISLNATDSQGARADLDIAITVTDIVESLIATTLASGFSSPVQVVPIPASNDLLIVEQAGIVRVLTPQTGAIATVPFLDISGGITSGGERGLLGLTFSPDFANDQMVFINLTNLNGDTEIRSYQTFTTQAQQADMATENLILEINQPFANHNAGWIGFDPDGNLLVPTGDGGAGGDPNGNAQDPNQLLGKVLRIDITSDDFPADDARDYAIPPTNPFATGGGAPEIYALGLRNPFRASIDNITGALYLADVGQNLIEEVDRIPAATPGLNFGWNAREGSQAFNGGANSADFVPPLLEYEHGNGPFEGNSILGGPVYRGPISLLNETYVFADTLSGNIWSVPLANLVDGVTLDGSAFTRLNDLFPAGFNPSLITSFAIDAAGNLLMTDLNGNLFAISEAP